MIEAREYLPSGKDLKMLQKIELEMLIELDRICKKIIYPTLWMEGLFWEL